MTPMRINRARSLISYSKDAAPTGPPCGLIQLRRDRGKDRIELRTDAIHGRDNSERDASGEQAVFDGGRAQLGS